MESVNVLPHLQLEEDSYASISARMLGEAPSLDPALLVAIKGINPSQHLVPCRTRQDTSFSRQMRALVADVPPDCQPDALLFTEVSAIPIADAVRGYYEGLGAEVPLLTSIKANRELAADYNKREGGMIRWTRDEKQEVKRLRLSLYGVRRIAIIDQYVWSGITRNYAAGLVFNATGVTRVTHVQGRWYDEITDRGSVDCESLTSTHSELMYEVGLLAAK